MTTKNEAMISIGICIATHYLIYAYCISEAIEILRINGIDRKELKILKKHGLNENIYEGIFSFIEENPEIEEFR